MGTAKGRAFVVPFLSATFLAAVAEFPAKVREEREDLFSLPVGTLSAHHGAKRQGVGPVF